MFEIWQEKAVQRILWFSGVVNWIELDKNWINKSVCDDGDKLLNPPATENFFATGELLHAQ
jgi:hypothetical protein